MSTNILPRMISRFRAQMKSTEMWMKFLEDRPDAPNIRNAAFALGKLSGLGAQLLEVAMEMNQALPDDIIKTIEAGPEQWDRINGA